MRLRGLRSCETMWLKLGEDWRSPVKNQFIHSDIASNVGEKWSKNYGVLMHPDRVMQLKYPKIAGISIFMFFILQQRSKDAWNHHSTLTFFSQHTMHYRNL